MGKTTAISWCDHTCNWWMGCTKVSTEASGGGACDHCYAEVRDKRFHAGAHWGPGAPRSERIMAAAQDLQRWNRAAQRDGVRRSVFINSLSDFFDNEVPQAWRDFAFGVEAWCNALDLRHLTKRIGNWQRMVPEPWMRRFPDHLQMGISVCTQLEVNRDVVKLLDVPVSVRYLSCEPLLGPLDIRGPLATGELHWVIVGGESGPHARPMNPQWARDVRDQCAAAGVPFHFKQWGEWASVSEVAGPGRHHTFDDGRTVRRTGAKLAGRALDGVEHLALPN